MSTPTGTEGQDRRSYSDTQDRQSYRPSTPTPTLTDLEWTFQKWNGPGDTDWIITTRPHGTGLKPIARIPASPFSEANARLIAHAPALVAALEAIATALEPEHDHPVNREALRLLAVKYQVAGSRHTAHQAGQVARALLAHIEEG